MSSEATSAPSAPVVANGLARRTQIQIGSAVIGLTAAVYAPVLYHLVLHWKIVPDYSHGFLVAPLSVYFAWQHKRELARVEIEGSWW